MRENNAVVRADGLEVGYEGIALLRDVSMHVEPGRIVTLVGPNGAGKSTLLRTLAGLLEPVSGSVMVLGKDLGDYRARELSLVRSVLLTDRLKPELLTCEDVVSAGRYPHTGRMGVLTGADRAKVRAAMEQLEVWDLRARDFMRLSDGQKQRVMLARALCQCPQVLMLDEPTSYLDIRYQIKLCRVLRTLAREQGVCIVMSLHELVLARQVSNWLVCVKDHTILRQGTPDDIFGTGVIDELFDLEPGGYAALLRGTALV